MITVIIVIVAIILLYALYVRVKTNAEIASDDRHREELERNDITSPPYKVGDYYNDGVHKGFVFSISNGGYHGKIVSMIQHQWQDWCKWSDTKQSWGCSMRNPPIICSSRTDGMENMRKLTDNMIKNYCCPVNFKITEKRLPNACSMQYIALVFIPKPPCLAIFTGQPVGYNVDES